MTESKTLAAPEENARLAALYQVSRALGSSLDLDETLLVVMRAAIRLTGAERGFLMLFDANGDLVFRVACNAHGAALAEEQFEISRSVVREVAQTGTPVVTTNATKDPRFASQGSVVAFALRSILAVPLTGRGRLIGVLYVDNKVRDALFELGDLELLNAFAGQAALAIENARLYTQTDQALAARVTDLQTLQTIDRQLNAALDFQHVLDVMLTWALRGTQAERAWVGLLDEPGTPVQVAGAKTRAEADGEAPAAAAGASPAVGDSLPLDHPWLERVLLTLEPAAFEPNGSTPAAVMAPLVREGRVRAVIVAERPAPAMAASAGAGALSFLARLADHAAIALENAQLYAAISQANDAKSEFVRTVSHELKIPMTSIKGYTDLLKMVGPLTEQQEQFVGVIRSNVERMAVLVSDLADIARIESGRLKVEIESVDLRDSVRDALNNLRSQLEIKQQSLTQHLPPDLPRLRTDSMRLVQVLANLISNAHKYSPPGRPITLSAAAADDFVRVSVADQGYGIGPADQARLFEQFFRSDEPSIREQPGWGLGLNIVQRLVRLLGGDIEVESVLGQGSVFTFTVPAE
jgi:signal transduction histidine kinase